MATATPKDAAATPPVIADAALAAIGGLAHGFFTREGGVSAGVYGTLNAGPGSGDDPANVAENRARAAAALGLAADRLVTLHQVHSAEAVRVDAPFAPGAAPRADALVTATPGLILGVLTADCAPVLLADPEARVVGAAHAGWRGALTGVLDAAVAAMAQLGARPERIAAAIGPCIGRRSYEVGPEFPAPFLAEDRGADRFFAEAPRAGHHLFDLAGYVAARLRGAGVAQVAVLGGDTCDETDRFFSYRRAFTRGEPDYGRALSAIALRD